MPSPILQKFAQIESAPNLAPYKDQVTRLRDYVVTAADWDMFRINVLRLAAELGLCERLIVDIFVHAAKIGLFDFQWNIICPGCGGIEYSLTSIGDLKERPYRCTICNIYVPSEIDDQIEVAFSLNAGIRSLQLNPFENFDSYRRFFFSANYERSPALMKYSKKNFIGWNALKPDQNVAWTADVATDESLRLLSMVSHSEMTINVGTGHATDTQVVQVELGTSGFMPRTLDVQAGRVEVHVHNMTTSTNAVTMMRADFGTLSEIMANHANTRKPFLTAKMLLNNQSFKDLFNVHNLPKDFNLRVRSLTLLFTDLKGSTQLYEKAGDLEAFHIVQEHFKILTAVVRRHFGATIKTMGDALMASFSTPADAVLAGVEMLEATRDFWDTHKVPEMGLKVGVHEGPALTINADGRLDYFGQTVNMAARIQGQAEVGDLVVSADVCRDESARQALEKRFGAVPAQPVQLKGIRAPVPVHRYNLKAR